jgi:hypothetical protein
VTALTRFHVCVHGCVCLLMKVCVYDWTREYASSRGCTDVRK